MHVVMEQLYVVKKIVVNLAVNYHVLSLMKLSAMKLMMMSRMMMMLSMTTTMMIWTTKTFQHHFGKLHNSNIQDPFDYGR